MVVTFVALVLSGAYCFQLMKLEIEHFFPVSKKIFIVCFLLIYFFSHISPPNLLAHYSPNNDGIVIVYRFFSYSLENRIIPRHKILVENRINMKLRYMLASTDEEFEKRVEAIKGRRQRFESGATNDEFNNLEKIEEDVSLEEMTMVDLSERDAES